MGALTVSHSYAAAYVLVISSIFFITMKKVRVLHAVLWAYDQYGVLTRLEWTKHWGEKMANAMRHLRKQPVCVLVKTDEVRKERLFPFFAFICCGVRDGFPWDPFLSMTARGRKLIPRFPDPCSVSQAAVC